MVFLHGLGCASSFDYPHIAAQPALQARRRVLVDLLGSGYIDRPEGFSYTTTDHGRVVVELLDSLNLSSVDLYGHSMGGSIAIEVAHRMAPRVRHLILSEPNLDSGGGAFSRGIAATEEAAYVASGHQNVIQESTSAHWAASMRSSAAYAVWRAARSLVDGVQPSWRALLVQLPMPRTVVFGEHSLPDPDVDALGASGVRTLILAGAGHSMAWEQPAGLAELIAQSAYNAVADRQ